MSDRGVCDRSVERGLWGKLHSPCAEASLCRPPVHPRWRLCENRPRRRNHMGEGLRVAAWARAL